MATKRKRAIGSPKGPGAAGSGKTPAPAAEELEQGKAALRATHSRVIGWFQAWQQEAQKWNDKARRDRDYYDNVQWTQPEIDKHALRGQPTLTFNHIAPKINSVIGEEAETRGTAHAYPRTRFHDEDAEAVTDALRYQDDKVEFDNLCDDVADNVLIEGSGGEVFGVVPEFQDKPRLDPQTQQPVMDADGQALTERVLAGYRITETQVPWSQFWFDVHSSKTDWSDAYYMGTAVWWDLDEARADVRYVGSPALESAQQLDTMGDDAADKPGWPGSWCYDPDRQRILILECYYKQFDSQTQRMEWYGCHLTGGGFLIDPFPVRPAGFVDEDGNSWCPMWMTSGLVRGRTNERYGVVRPLTSPQDLVNKMMSKLMHELNVRGYLMERGAVLDKQGFLTEVAKPDALGEVEDGALTEGRIQEIAKGEVTSGHLQLLQEAKMAMQTLGPNIQAIAGAQQQLSGRAFIAMMQAGAKEMKPIFSNLKRWRIGSWRRKWWLMKRHWTAEMWLRVRDDERGFRFVALNKQTTRGDRFLQLVSKDNPPDEVVEHAFGYKGERLWGEAQAAAQQQMQQAAMMAKQAGQPFQPNPDALKVATLQALLATQEAKEPFTANDVAKLDVDIVIAPGPSSVVAEHEQFMELMGMLRNGDVPRSPEMVAELLDSSSLRNKAKLKKLLLKPPDPAQQQMQMQQMQMTLAELQAKVAKLTAETAETQARARLAQQQAAAVPSEALLNQARAEDAQASAGVKVHQAHLDHALAVRELAQPPAGQRPG